MAKKEKICPLRLSAFKNSVSESNRDDLIYSCRCLKNKCEWYDDEYQECIIRAISTL